MDVSNELYCIGYALEIPDLASSAGMLVQGLIGLYFLLVVCIPIAPIAPILISIKIIIVVYGGLQIRRHVFQPAEYWQNIWQDVLDTHNHTTWNPDWKISYCEGDGYSYNYSWTDKDISANCIQFVNDNDLNPGQNMQSNCSTLLKEKLDVRYFMILRHLIIVGSINIVILTWISLELLPHILVYIWEKLLSFPATFIIIFRDIRLGIRRDKFVIREPMRPPEGTFTVRPVEIALAVIEQHNNTECKICFNVVPQNEMATFSRQCGHIFCRPCLNQHVKAQLENSNLLYIRCLEVQCPISKDLVDVSLATFSSGTAFK